MDWTAEAIERLRVFWSEGHSTAEIGRRMGVSKNSVVGKAHRLQLPARPSPIRRDPTMARPAATGRRPTLPPLRVVATVPPAPTPRGEEARPAQPPAAVSPPAPKGGNILRPFARSTARSCCWPIGEPGTPGFRFCTAEAMNTKPYCAEHAAVAYVRVKDRREDAA
jgi:GcrA cell cycle regulator